ncbi:hypothetical protein KUTeg_020296 [Tegillarca granosa]|uniref:PiggyBac transposable element-derived protein domain-containing protein n=1 Tax=Tegillarca granosa TaxID=220873 RepID=A0ABQ9E7F3_TEGGR|nr:hypothetical protein KUTeg_020296 [Tegillarca granosa]
MAGLWVRVFPGEEKQRRPFTARPHLMKMPPRDASPIIYFNLLFSMTLLKEIGRQTNSYANNYISKAGNRIARFSRVRSWKKLTLEEFKKFLALFFNMGIKRKPQIIDYWHSHLPSQTTSWFKGIMSRNRFQNILKFLHVADFKRVTEREKRLNMVPIRSQLDSASYKATCSLSLTNPIVQLSTGILIEEDEDTCSLTIKQRNHPGYDPAARIRPLLTYINNRFKQFCVPDRELCVDESLVATKGRTVMQQYIPTKAVKYGINFGCSVRLQQDTFYRW